MSRWVYLFGWWRLMSRTISVVPFSHLLRSCIKTHKSLKKTKVHYWCILCCRIKHENYLVFCSPQTFNQKPVKKPYWLVNDGTGSAKMPFLSFGPQKYVIPATLLLCLPDAQEHSRRNNLAPKTSWICVSAWYECNDVHSSDKMPLKRVYLIDKAFK